MRLDSWHVPRSHHFLRQKSIHRSRSCGRFPFPSLPTPTLLRPLAATSSLVTKPRVGRRSPFSSWKSSSYPRPRGRGLFLPIHNRRCTVPVAAFRYYRCTYCAVSSHAPLRTPPGLGARIAFTGTVALDRLPVSRSVGPYIPRNIRGHIRHR